MKNDGVARARFGYKKVSSSRQEVLDLDSRGDKSLKRPEQLEAEIRNVSVFEKILKLLELISSEVLTKNDGIVIIHLRN